MSPERNKERAIALAGPAAELGRQCRTLLAAAVTVAAFVALTSSVDISVARWALFDLEDHVEDVRAEGLVRVTYDRYVAQRAAAETEAVESWNTAFPDRPVKSFSEIDFDELSVQATARPNPRAALARISSSRRRFEEASRESEDLFKSTWKMHLEKVAHLYNVIEASEDRLQLGIRRHRPTSFDGLSELMLANLDVARQAFTRFASEDVRLPLLNVVVSAESFEDFAPLLVLLLYIYLRLHLVQLDRLIAEWRVRLLDLTSSDESLPGPISTWIYAWGETGGWLEFSASLVVVDLLVPGLTFVRIRSAQSWALILVGIAFFLFRIVRRIVRFRFEGLLRLQYGLGEPEWAHPPSVELPREAGAAQLDAEDRRAASPPAA